MTAGNPDKDWIRIKTRRKLKNVPSEIRIDTNGNVYIDGEPFDEARIRYSNLAVDVERHNKMNTGEETRQIIEKGKTAKRGELVTIKDVKGPDSIESTTVKF